MNLCSRNEYEQNEDKSKRYAWEGLCQELAHLLDIPNVNVGKCRTENELQYFVGAEFEIKEHRSWWPVEISEIYFKNEYNPPLFGIKYIEGNYCIVKTLKWMLQQTQKWSQATSQIFPHISRFQGTNTTISSMKRPGKLQPWVEAANILGQFVSSFSPEFPQAILNYHFEEYFPKHGWLRCHVSQIVKRNCDILSGPLFVIVYHNYKSTLIKNTFQLKEAFIKSLKRKHGLDEAIGERSVLEVLQMLEKNDKVDAMEEEDSPAKQVGKSTLAIESEKQEEVVLEIKNPTCKDSRFTKQVPTSNMQAAGTQLESHSAKVSRENTEAKVVQNSRNLSQNTNRIKSLSFIKLARSDFQETKLEEEDLPISYVFGGLEELHPKNSNSLTTSNNLKLKVKLKNFNAIQTKGESSWNQSDCLKQKPFKMKVVGTHSHLQNELKRKILCYMPNPKKMRVPTDLSSVSGSVNCYYRLIACETLFDVMGCMLRASTIEKAIYTLSGQLSTMTSEEQRKEQYKLKFRQIKFNLKKNRTLRERVLAGEYTAEDLVNAQPDDLKSDEDKLETLKIRQKNFELSRIDINWDEINIEKVNKLCGIEDRKEGPDKPERLSSQLENNSPEFQNRNANYVSTKPPFPFVFGTQIKQYSPEWHHVWGNIFLVLGLKEQPETERDREFYFPGTIASPLSHGTMLTSSMLVTWRALGHRALIYVKGENQCYAVDKNLNCQKIPLQFPSPDNPDLSLKDTIIDGVFVQKTQDHQETSQAQHRFYAFDLLAFQGINYTQKKPLYQNIQATSRCC